LALGGVCNPVETAFTPAGEVVGTISVYDDFENRRRDAVVHWIDGGVFNLAEKNYAGVLRTGNVQRIWLALIGALAGTQPANE